jgi:hypothetical protein
LTGSQYHAHRVGPGRVVGSGRRALSGWVGSSPAGSLGWVGLGHWVQSCWVVGSGHWIRPSCWFR